MTLKGVGDSRAICLLFLAMAPSIGFAETAAVREAKQHFETGAKAYKLGDYQRAIEEYKASYGVYPAPLLLYDLGQTYRKLGQFELALHSYNQYLADAPTDSAHRTDAEEQVKELKKLLADQRARQTAPPDGVAESDGQLAVPAGRKSRSRVSTGARTNRLPSLASGISLSVLLLAGSIAAGVSLAHAAKLDDQAAAATTVDLRNSLLSSAGDYRTGGWVSLGIGGGALVGAAIAWTFFGIAVHESHRVAVAVAPSASGALLSVGGAW